LSMPAASSCIWSSFHHLCVVYRRGVLYTKRDTECTQCTHMGRRKPRTNEKYAPPASIFNQRLGRHFRWSSSWSTRVTGTSHRNDYLQFLREELPVMLEDVHSRKQKLAALYIQIARQAVQSSEFHYFL
jgi:hypothetical protein